MASRAATLRSAHDEISAHLNEIGMMFTPRMKLTFLARDPDYPDGSRDMVVSADAIPDAIAALSILANRPAAARLSEGTTND